MTVSRAVFTPVFRPVTAALFSLFGTFSPKTLFSNNEQGVWYDPSDLTTLFQDAAGTTPVTAVEQPVGLMLDKSKGLVLEPELVTTQDLTAWASRGNFGVYNGSSATANTITTTASTYGSRYIRFATTPGKTYSVSANATNITSTSARVIVAFGTSGLTSISVVASTQASTKQSVIAIAPATAAFVEICVVAYGSIGAVAQFDNISVRELPGNHAYQSTSAARPVLSARYNLLTKTEQFDDAAWTKLSATVTANTTATTDPLGGDTADKVLEYADTNFHQVGQLHILDGNYTWSFYAKAAERSYVTLTFATNDLLRKWFNGIVDLSNGNSKVLNTLNSPTYSNFTATSVGNGWYRISVTFTTSNTSGSGTLVAAVISNSYSPPVDALGRPSYTGDGTSGIYIWGADLRVANDGVGIPAYQRVNTETDYDTVGFPKYLRFNGSSSAMMTNTITPGTDKAQVFAGVRKLSDALRACVAEFGNLGTPLNGSWFINAPLNALAQEYTFASHGTVTTSAMYNNAAVKATVTNVLTGLGDISGDSAILRVNGTQVASSTADQGTGNYGNYPLYIGARAGTSYWLNGRVYSMIVRFGSNLTTTQITNTENYVNSKTKAY